MKKKLLASLLSLCLTVGLLPTSALAAEGMAGDKQTPANCTLTEKCALFEGHEGDCVMTDREEESDSPVPAMEVESAVAVEDESVQNNRKEVPAVEGDMSERESLLPEAVDGVITLTQDVVFPEGVVFREETILDLNGYTLTLHAATEEDPNCITVERALKILDSSQSQTGRMKSSFSPYGGTKINVSEGASLTIANGTFDFNGTPIILHKNTSLDIQGGSISAYRSVWIPQNEATGITITMSGGKLSATGDFAFRFYLTPANSDGINFKMTGGEVECNGGAFYNDAKGVFSISGGKMTSRGGNSAVHAGPATAFTISGGTFISEKQSAVSGTINITGGTFSQNLIENVESKLSPGFTLSRVNDTYKVDNVTPAAKINDVSYETLAAAAAAAKAGDVITLLRDAEKTPIAIPDGVSVETNGYVYYGKIKATDSAGNIITTTTAPDGYFCNMVSAVRETAAYPGAVLDCAPNSHVIFQESNDAALQSDLTVNGHNATAVYSTDPARKDEIRFAVENFDSTKFQNDVTLRINDLNNAGILGNRKTDYTFTLYMKGCDTVDPVNDKTHRVYINNGVGTNNIYLEDCTFSKAPTAVYTNAGGELSIKDCTFEGGVAPINININTKSTTGDMKVTIEDCTLTGELNVIESGQQENADYAAPIRITNSGGRTTEVSIKNCRVDMTTNGSNELINGDIFLEQAKGNVTAEISGCDVTVQTQKGVDADEVKLSAEESETFVVANTPLFQHGASFVLEGGQLVGEILREGFNQIILPGAEREGYELAAWSDGTNTYPAGEIVKLTADTIFTAQWRKEGGSSGGGGITTPSYSITVPAETEGGKVSVSPNPAKQGDTVTVIVETKEGYELKELMVTDAGGTKIALTQVEEGKFTFTMPGSGVKIEAVFGKPELKEQEIKILKAQVRGLADRDLNDRETKVKFAEGKEPKTAVTYESSNDQVVAVDKEGHIRYTGLGEAVITVKAEETEEYKAAEIAVTVKVGLRQPTFTPTPRDNGFVVTSSTVRGAEKFQVQYVLKGRSFNHESVKSKTFTADNKLRKGKVSAANKRAYRIRVRAISGDVKSKWSPVKNITTK